MQSEDDCKDWYEGEEMQFTIEQMTGSTCSWKGKRNQRSIEVEVQVQVQDQDQYRISISQQV